MKKQKSIPFVNNSGLDDIFHYERNELNGNWMFWFESLRPKMFSGTRQMVNGILKTIGKEKIA